MTVEDSALSRTSVSPLSRARKHCGGGGGKMVMVIGREREKHYEILSIGYDLVW